MGLCIVNIFQYISNKTQLYTVYLYPETALHVSGGTSAHHQERLQLHQQHLVFVTPLLLPAAIAAGSSSCWTLSASSNYTANNPPRMRTRGCECSLRLLMMGSVSPEKCWASYKYEIKILIHCCILLDFLCELDMTMLILNFRNFANAPKNQTLKTYVPHCMTEYLVIDQSNILWLIKVISCDWSK